MARASYIYLIVADHGPTQAFTVKHELISHMKRYPEALKNRTVWRLPDSSMEGVVFSQSALDYLAEHG
jgi:hypothetical protein